jgi:hypothetical protein
MAGASPQRMHSSIVFVSVFVIDSSANRREEVIACLLAPAADFGTDAAVLVMGGMEVAFGSAGKAGSHTRFD